MFKCKSFDCRSKAYIVFFVILDFPENVNVSVKGESALSGTYLLNRESVGSESISPAWENGSNRLMRINGLWTIAKVKAKSVFTFTPIADIWGGSAEGNNGSKSYVYFFDDGMEIREKPYVWYFF